MCCLLSPPHRMLPWPWWRWGLRSHCCWVVGREEGDAPTFQLASSRPLGEICGHQFGPHVPFEIVRLEMSRAHSVMLSGMIFIPATSMHPLIVSLSFLLAALWVREWEEAYQLPIFIFIPMNCVAVPHSTALRHGKVHFSDCSQRRVFCLHRKSAFASVRMRGVLIFSQMRGPLLLAENQSTGYVTRPS